MGLYVGILNDLPKLDIPINSGRSAPIRIYDSGHPATLLAELAGPITADPVPAQDMPEVLRQALIAAEDEAFPLRGTMSIGSLARILRAEIWGEAAQTVSPITLGFIHENYVAGRTHPRPRLYEAALAYRLEQSWSKERILTSYLNTLYFGEGCYGVAAAAQRYFGLRPAALSTAQAAMLIGLAVSTDAPAPRTNPDAAVAARNHVLNRMFQEGYLDGKALQEALAEPFELNPVPTTPASRSTTWTDFIEDQLVRRYGAARILRGGLTVSTTLDLSMQETAEATLLQALKDAPQGSQGLIVAVDLPSGAVVAMAQTSKGQAAEALSTPREAGRLLRPVILAAAFERGISPLTAYTTDAGQMILYQGATTADADTYDRVARQVGREAVLDTARLLGLGAALQADGSDYGDDLASLRVTPLQVATLFTALATEGRAPVSGFATATSGGIAVRTILQVESSDGSLVDHGDIAWRDALSTDTGFLITSILASTPHELTLPADVFPPGTVATLTAPSRTGSEAWFVGYSSGLLTVVWVGGWDYDDVPTASAATSAAPSTAGAAAESACAIFMERTAATVVPQEFKPPATTDWEQVTVCAASGSTPSSGCPVTIQVLVPLSLVPTETCSLHTRAARVTTTTIPDTTTTHTTTTDTEQEDVVNVPSVVGLTPGEAEVRLAAVGLRLVCTVGAPGSRPGLIASQNPSPGATVRRGQTISAIVEALPPTSTLTTSGGAATTTSR